MILWYETAGFALIILLSWLDELLNLPFLIFGGVPHSEWRESALETVIILAVWVVVISLTRTILKRLHYLEGLLRMCAWCRKVNDGDEWVSTEEFFSRKFSMQTSHGMCPACAEKTLADLK